MTGTNVGAEVAWDHKEPFPAVRVVVAPVEKTVPDREMGSLAAKGPRIESRGRGAEEI